MMTNFIFLFLLTLKILLISITPSYAYLDPGTGGVILQFIVATIAFFGFYFRKVKIFVKNFFQKNKKKTPKEK